MLKVKECPRFPGYFFREDGLFSIGSETGPFLRGLPNNCNGLTYRRIHRMAPNNKFVHRMMAFTFCHNPCPDIFKHVDHINGDTECNEAWNLRWVNRVLNRCNSSSRNSYLNLKVPIQNAAGKRRWVWSRPRWQAKLIVDGVKYKLGFYDTEEAASDVSRKFRETMFRKIYLDYLKERNVGEEKAASFALQPRKAPIFTTVPMLGDSRTQWLSSYRSARMYFCSPRAKDPQDDPH